MPSTFAEMEERPEPEASEVEADVEWEPDYEEQLQQACVLLQDSLAVMLLLLDFHTKVRLTQKVRKRITDSALEIEQFLGADPFVDDTDGDDEPDSAEDGI